jgi:hypothetical protein
MYTTWMRTTYPNIVLIQRWSKEKTDSKEDYPEVYFSQIFSSLDISQTGTDIENPYGDNVHDMDENNIPEYRANPTVEGGVIAVG